MTFKPRLFKAALILMAGGLAACEGGMNPFESASGMNPFGSSGGSSGATATFTPITTEEAFRAQVVGREVVYANGAVGSYGQDGTWAVTDGDAVIGQGTWQWTGDRWCRQGTTAEGAVPAGCDAVAISATGVRFTREDGTEGVLPFRA